MKTLCPCLNKSLTHIFTLALVCTFSAAQAQSQYYPGGLGNGSLQLWLTAADATTLKNPGGAQAANGDFIAKWTDKSGNNNHATQNTSGAQPVSQTNALNGNAGVIFQNASEGLSGPSAAYQTIVAVRSMPGAGHYQYLFSSPANQDFSIRGGGASTVYADGPNGNDWTSGTGSATTLTQWINGTQGLTGSNTNHILVSSAANPTNATYSLSNIITGQAWSGRGMNGNDPVYEILAYNTTLSTTQRQIIENYEAATWGLESLLPSSGYTIFTPPSANSFNKNLVGIGYTSSTDNVTSNAATSTDGLGFSSSTSNTGFLHNAGFLMAAHNGQAATVNTNASIPGIISGSAISLWNRSWYIQQSGGNASGQMTLNFNFTQYNGSTPNAASTYAVIYNATDGTFATGTNTILTAASTAVSGGTVSVTVTASNLASGYYALSYSSKPIVLPLQLTAFTVTAQQNTALLNWTMEQAAGIEHFNVQHSTDGATFAAIGTVAAAAGDAGSANYSFTDENPAKALNYYRIEIVNQDGSTTYSGIRTLGSASTATATVNIYPNPATDRLHITTAANTAFNILIIDVQGRIVRQVLVSSGNTADITVSDLVKGIYFAEILTGNSKTVTEFLKN
jgi:Secretion system C-terminal sorting domain